jgi:hypothetical protein
MNNLNTETQYIQEKTLKEQLQNDIDNLSSKLKDM